MVSLGNRLTGFLHVLWYIYLIKNQISNLTEMIQFLRKEKFGSSSEKTPKQTLDGFYQGESVPVNRKLSDIFLQLHISERSGRGVPQITKVYGRDAFEFRENSIVVTIPFDKLDTNVGDKVVDKVGDKTKKLNPTRQRIVEEVRNNPNITQPQLMTVIGIGKTAIQNNIAFLRKNGYIERVGSNKNGYWRVL
jgi:predicted HTH transcriptional regulator